MLLLKRILNEDVELLNLATALRGGRFEASQGRNQASLNRGPGAGGNSCDLTNLTCIKRKCCVPSRSFGSHSIFCCCKIIFINKAPGKAGVAERQLEAVLWNDSKIDPKVCTIPRPQRAEKVSSTAGRATGLGDRVPSPRSLACFLGGYLCSQCDPASTHRVWLLRKQNKNKCK